MDNNIVFTTISIRIGISTIINKIIDYITIDGEHITASYYIIVASDL